MNAVEGRTMLTSIRAQVISHASIFHFYINPVFLLFYAIIPLRYGSPRITALPPAERSLSRPWKLPDDP
jgi:hypothetical protein